MKIVNNINNWLLRYIQPRRLNFSIQNNQLIVENTKYNLSDLNYIAAYKKNLNAGTAITLYMVFKNGKGFTINETDEIWEDLLKNLDKSGRITRSSSEWQAELIGRAPKREPIILLEMKKF